MKRDPNHNRKLNNTRIFVNALLKGEIKLAYEVSGGKRIAIYIPTTPKAKSEN